MNYKYGMSDSFAVWKLSIFNFVRRLNEKWEERNTSGGDEEQNRMKKREDINRSAMWNE